MGILSEKFINKHIPNPICTNLHTRTIQGTIASKVGSIVSKKVDEGMKPVDTFEEVDSEWPIEIFNIDGHKVGFRAASGTFYPEEYRHDTIWYSADDFMHFNRLDF
jgi:hypothetical protein